MSVAGPFRSRLISHALDGQLLRVRRVGVGLGLADHGPIGIAMNWEAVLPFPAASVAPAFLSP